MSRWKRIIFVHGKDCSAEETGRREDCRCNLKKPAYDRAWRFHKHYDGKNRYVTVEAQDREQK